MYTIWVSDNDSQPITGELTFGSINPKYHYGTLAKLPINSQVTFAPLHFLLPQHKQNLTSTKSCSRHVHM